MEIEIGEIVGRRRERFEMRCIHACFIAAFMIELEARGDRTVHEFPGEAVGWPISSAIPKRTVASGFPSDPLQTPIYRIRANLRPKARDRFIAWAPYLSHDGAALYKKSASLH